MWEYTAASSVTKPPDTAAWNRTGASAVTPERSSGSTSAHASGTEPVARTSCRPGSPRVYRLRSPSCRLTSAPSAATTASTEVPGGTGRRWSSRAARGVRRVREPLRHVELADGERTGGRARAVEPHRG